jgi:hypothetical protein
MPPKRTPAKAAAAAPPKKLGPIALLLISAVAKVAAKWLVDWFINLISERNWFEEGEEVSGDKMKELLDEMIVATPRRFIRKRAALRALFHMAPRIASKSLTAADKEELRGSFAIPNSEK